ncbi:MAG: hypothetical protein ACXWXO_18495 [Nocardioides sp.]
MAKKSGDGEKQEPTLELPSLFGRGKKRRAEPVEPPVERPVEETQPIPAPEPAPEPAPVAPAEPKRRAPKPARAVRAARTTPPVSAQVAAVLTGLVVGLLGTALTYVALRGCEMLKGTESCGGPGLGVLVAIVVLMVIGGAVMLKLLGVSDPRGTSFLAVGLMSVIVLVTLMENLFSAWMFVAIPLVCGISFAVSHWVTTRFVETVDDRPHVDVR